MQLAMHSDLGLSFSQKIRLEVTTLMEGDADTNVAVSGAILGTKFGFSSIPVEWVDGLVQKKT